MTSHPSTPAPSSKPLTRRGIALWVFLLLLATALFMALGTWQVKRLSWKLELIARVDARVHAEPQAAPGRAAWAMINARDDEYRHVRIEGTFLNEAETQVYAATDLGAGFWVLTPLKAADGTITLINRGFVPGDKREPQTRQDGELSGPVTVTGLLRINEPKGTLLRSNAPADNRWYSRDVNAMAQAHGLAPGDVAPYFIDADAAANPGNLPVGGLTQVVFPNSHLQYAITWFVMAAMSIGMCIYLIFFEGRRNRE